MVHCWQCIYFYCFSEPFAYLCVAGLLTSLVAQVGTQGDASSHQGQTEQGLQRQPGEVKQRLHAGAVQLHKGILRGERGGEKERIRESTGCQPTGREASSPETWAPSTGHGEK